MSSPDTRVDKPHTPPCEGGGPGNEADAPVRGAPLSPSAEQLRRTDRDRFVLTLLAPPRRRPVLFALFAWHVELARVPFMVSDPLAGAVRLQYWHDLVRADDPISSARRHPMAEEVARHVLPDLAAKDRGLLVALLEACVEDLPPDPPPDDAAVLRVADRTSGALSEIAARLLGVDDPASRAVARHAGTAWGLVALARATPALINAGRLRLPVAALRAAGRDPGTVLAGNDEDRRGIRAGVAALSALATQELAQVQGAMKGGSRRLDERVGPMARQTILATHGLRTLTRARHDPFDGRVAALRAPALRLVGDRLIRGA